MAREGVFRDWDVRDALPLARAPLRVLKLLARKRAGSHSLSRAMERLGPSFVKLGQFLATRPDIVSVDVARELERLQDRAAPLPRDIAIQRIESAFQQPIGALFLQFGEPVAAASIAQVHRAQIASGQWVAVKVLRPGIDRRFARDIATMDCVARLLHRLFPQIRRLKPVEVVEILARTVKMEMDLRLEAAAATEFAENICRDETLRVPKIDWDRTTREVLTLEWIDGLPLSDRHALVARGLDVARLGRELIQSFLRHALRDGFFHADMHQGNVLVDAQGRIVMLDFGIMGRLGRTERRFLAEIIYGFIKKDYRRVAEVHFEAGYVPRHYRIEDFAQALRAIGEPIHSRSAEQISMARLLTLLFEVTALFEMTTRIELVLLQKTMVVVEGVARGLNPQLNMWQTAEPVVGAWIKQNLGMRGRVEDMRHKVGATWQTFVEVGHSLRSCQQALSVWEKVQTKPTRSRDWLFSIALVLVIILLMKEIFRG